MPSQVTLPKPGRDLRLDLFRGIANWAIFLDHIPGNVVNWITTRNYGFSDAADLFVFISGYTASLVYARMMQDRGFVVGATRLFKRVWQLYVAHIVLFVIYIAGIGVIAQQSGASDIIHQFNIASLIDSPIQMLSQGLLLRFKPVNLDILPLYIVLMALFPPVLWLMLRKPEPVMLASLLLYFASRYFRWNLPSYQGDGWFFNPFTWQLLFVFGAWCALGRLDGYRSTMAKSRGLLYLAVVYLAFALLMTMGSRFPEFAKMFPTWLFDAFNPNDKTFLAPYRVLHFIVIAFLVTRFMPKDWRGLEWRLFKPIIKCGQQSLAVFCVGSLLSFLGLFTLMLSSGSLLAQIFVSLAGIAIMTAVAYYVSWSKQQDKARPKAPDVAAGRAVEAVSNTAKQAP